MGAWQAGLSRVLLLYDLPYRYLNATAVAAPSSGVEGSCAWARSRAWAGSRVCGGERPTAPLRSDVVVAAAPAQSRPARAQGRRRLGSASLRVVQVVQVVEVVEGSECSECRAPQAV